MSEPLAGFGEFVEPGPVDETPADPSAPPPGFSTQIDFGPGAASVVAANEGPPTE